MSLQREVDAIVAAKIAKEKETEEAENQKKELERLAQFAIAEAKIPPLLAVLQECKCKELLEQVWDEFWKRGEFFSYHQYPVSIESAGVHVTPYPSIDTFKAGDPTDYAEAVFEIKWSYRDKVGHKRSEEYFIKIEARYSTQHYYTMGQIVLVVETYDCVFNEEIIEPDAAKIKNFILEVCALKQKKIINYKQQIEEEKTRSKANSKASDEYFIKRRAEQEQERLEQKRVLREREPKRLSPLIWILLIVLGLPFSLCMISWIFGLLTGAR